MAPAGLAILVTAAILPQETTNKIELTFKGEPVHPAAVRMLVTRISDVHPTAVAIDLDGARNNNEFVIPFTRTDGVFRYTYDAGWNGGVFLYEYVGVTPGRVHVVRTAERTGGSGIFGHLLFLRIEEGHFLDDAEIREQTLLRCTGSLTLGDRSNAVVALDGDRLTVTGLSEPIALDLDADR